MYAKRYGEVAEEEPSCAQRISSAAPHQYIKITIELEQVSKMCPILSPRAASAAAPC
jgi:hypothetical protein